MSLEEKIEVLTKGVCLLIEAVKANTASVLPPMLAPSGDLPSAVETKPTRTRRTKAQIKADEKKNPCSIDLGPAPQVDAPSAPARLASDPLDILDTPTPAEDEDKITEEKLRLAGSELCEIGGEEGLVVAKKLIVKAGFEALDQVTEDKYKDLYDAFKLAVITWKK